VAIQLLTADRVRAWEIMSEAVKAANTTEKFTGEDTEIHLQMLGTRAGIKFSSIAAADVSLAHVLRSLALDDLNRSIDLAKGFKSDATRAAATLAIARSIIDQKVSNTARN
jgi:hypothetical protein